MRRPFSLDPAERDAIARGLAATLRDDSSVVFAYAFGSFIGDLPFRDIDIGVHLADPPAARTSRAMDLSVRLSRRVGYPVDVRAINDAPMPFLFHALTGTLLVSRDDRVLAEALDRGRVYLDIAPVLRRATREAFAR